MPRPQRPWFRFYTEALADRKLRRLPAAQRWLWVAVLGAARQSPVPGVLLVGEGQPMDDRDLADVAGMPMREVRKGLAEFEKAGMIVRDENVGAWAVTKWAERQYESDTSTERTRKHRSQERSNGAASNVPTSFEGTPPETETETDTSPPPQTTHGGTRPEMDGGIIEQSVILASERYATDQARAGKASNPQGLAAWWRQENAQGARVRAAQLLDDHDLTAAQLADVLLSPANPPWLAGYRRRDGSALDDIMHGDPPDPDQLERVHEMTTGLHRSLPKRARGAR